MALLFGLRLRLPAGSNQVGSSSSQSTSKSATVKRVAASIAIVPIFALVMMAGAGADVLLANFLQAGVRTGGDGIRVYEYGTGTHELFTSQADFDSGSYGGLAATDADGDGDYELNDGLWWDGAWQDRTCFNITIPQPQYPVKVVIDTSAAATDDIRVVEHPVSAAVAVPHYTEWRTDPSETVVWFQADSSGTGRYCVYFNNPLNPGSTSDEFAPFTYTSGQTVSYHMLQETPSAVSIHSYVDNNTVTYNGITGVLNAGEGMTFTAQANTIVEATGPIEVGGVGYDIDTLVPEGFAQNRFTMPTERLDQTFYLRSLGGPTTVRVFDGSTQVGSVAISDTGVTFYNPPGDRDYLTLVSDGNVPFIAAHTGAPDGDLFLGVPWFDEPLYGVPSQYLRIGSDQATTVNWRNSSGSSGIYNVSTSSVTSSSALGSFGSAPAYELSSSDYFAAIQQADNDGVESSSFLPRSLLSRTFILPLKSRYLAFACPVPGTKITIAGTVNVCNGSGIGKLVYHPDVAAGSVVQADHPVFMYLENSDERNVLGAKGHIPVGGATIERGCGMWTSPVFDTKGVFGRTTISATTDAEYEFLVSFDGGPFLGPDGTSDTSYQDGTIIAYEHDFVAATAQIRLEVCRGAVADVGLRHDLTEISLDPITESHHHVTVAASQAVLRVHPNHQVTWVDHYRTTGGPDTYLITTDRSQPQIQATAGAVSPTPDPFPSQPFTIFVAEATPQSATQSIDIVTETGAGTVANTVGVALEINISGA